MATLVSPGVSISVSDESFYASAGAGTVPLIIVATAQDKSLELQNQNHIQPISIH